MAPDHPDALARFIGPDALARFIGLCGDAWAARIDVLHRDAAVSPRAGRMLRQRHAIELSIARHGGGARPQAAAALDVRLGQLAAVILDLHDGLDGGGRDRLWAMIHAGLSGSGSLIPLFHLAGTILLHRSRGFAVVPAGLGEGAPFDLLLRRDGEAAELSCETVSAEDGRDLHRAAWFNLVDGIDPDLQTWLSAHPGRYLLKMTLPHGLRAEAADGGVAALSELQRRIREMLSMQRRADHDEAAVLRLDPLLLAGAQAGELGLLDALRAQFGPEAQLAVTRAGAGVLVMAARAGRENRVGAAVRARMACAAPVRFSGDLPGILSIFLEDTDRSEWRALRDGLQLEGEARQFLTGPEAAGLVAVTAACRVELLDGAAEEELRFRNQSHPAARSVALAPAIRSTG